MEEEIKPEEQLSRLEGIAGFGGIGLIAGCWAVSYIAGYEIPGAIYRTGEVSLIASFLSYTIRTS